MLRQNMCGIIGYVGKKAATPILLEGLRRLQYRGYDSAGLAVLNDGQLALRKKVGKLDEGLARLVEDQPITGQTGIGHTRWATHGPPSDENSHPHLDQSGKIAVVHNGVIENCDRLKERFRKAGHTFHSATDTEVLAHLIGDCYDRQPRTNGQPGSLTQAVCDALREVIGTYGIAVISSEHPGLIVGARRGSPLIIGIGEQENFLASDANAIVAHTRQVVYLNDYDVATVTGDRFDVQSLGTDTAKVQISRLEFASEEAERGSYAHFMLKEIFEQPRTVENALRGRIDFEGATTRFGGLNMTLAELRSIERIVIAATGTSWHAALAGAKRRGHRALSIINVVGSTIARESDGGIYMHAGPEIGVASTKAFVSTLTILTLLGVHLGRMRMLSAARATDILRALEAAPGQIEAILAQDAAIKKLALKYAKAENFFFLSRGYTYPIALEGALKLKEISYIHAEGYSAAEMKHGPIALIDPKTPVVFIIPQDSMYEKTLANLAMIRARQGPIIALASEGDTQIQTVADDVFYLPRTLEPIYPILATVPLQLLAYHIAVARGCDVDKPRNLAKSVTVQ
jgi:glucosamine--fructose-6-phosphate aminotransferase (isomerizing)